MAKTLYTAPTGKSAKSGSTLAPNPTFGETAPVFYEAKTAPNKSGQQGPARFYEGLLSDKSIGSEFQKGISQGYITPAGHPNDNMNVYEKLPAETMAERAHPGSAAWPEATSYTDGFSHGAHSQNAERTYEQVDRGSGLGKRWERKNAAEVTS
jgi:hypothetical protein